MKGFITLFLTLTSVAAFATSSMGINWQIVNSESYYADSEKEMTALFNQYPQILDNTTYQAKDMEFVSVSDSIFEFIGETTCADGDARLNHQSITYFACPIDHPTECITKFDDLRSNNDPCL